MKDASTQILDVLSKRGYRITAARKSIIDVLLKQTQPVSVQTLASLVSSDEASVYRTVRMLMKEELLEEIAPLPGALPRYIFGHADEHHHHVICSDCGFVEHVPCETASSGAEIPTSFTEILSHEVTLYGLCKKCG